MIVSLNWLRKYIDLTHGAQEISEALTGLGFEVEALEEKGKGLENVVVAEVLEAKPHPDADKLSLCRVHDGSQEYPVVCGAPNVRTGQKVALAKVGAHLPNGMEIRKAKIRGEVSMGMLCAKDELGLGDDHSGILVLPDETEPGKPLVELPGIQDTVFELGITPNRPDGLSHLGVARELAAHFRLDLVKPSMPLETVPTDGKPKIKVRIEAHADCSKYVGRVISDITVGPSPAWLQDALRSVGQKPINNVVDATNYALLEWGQPSHAFDADRLMGGEVIVRRARKGERLRTLDGEERELDGEDCVIADAEVPTCMAGVMGGMGTEVTGETRNVFLEVAYFTPGSVRRQARRHQMMSDSSYRFERGVDPLCQEAVSDYLAALIAKVAGGRVVDHKEIAQTAEHPREERVLVLRTQRVSRVLGVDLDPEEIVRLLAGIGIALAGRTGEGHLMLSVPGFRPDLEREVDLIEEVARLNNLDSIPMRLPVMAMEYRPPPRSESLSREIRRLLSGEGVDEALSLRFISQKAIDRMRFGPDDERGRTVKLINPLSEEWEALPTALLPGLLNSVAHNHKNQERDCCLFEISKVFHRIQDSPKGKETGVLERPALAMVLSGDWHPISWKGREPIHFYHLKGILERLFGRLGYSVTFSPGSGEPYLHPVESAALEWEGARLGAFGALHPAVARDFDVKGPVWVAELDLERFVQRAPELPQFRAFSGFSYTTREMNILVDALVPHARIEEQIPIEEIPHLREVKLLQVYQGQGIPEGQKAMLYSLVYQSVEKTLTDEEINAIQERVAGKLASLEWISFK